MLQQKKYKEKYILFQNCNFWTSNIQRIIVTFLEDIDPDLLIAAEKYNINVFLILRLNFS